MPSDPAPRRTTPARHAEGAQRSLGAIVWSFFIRLKWRYLPMVLSDYGRDILRRKYDAIATDRAYEDRPSGLLGPVGRLVDRIVLDFPLHLALRQRLELVVGSLDAEARRCVREGAPTVRLLSAPCGLVRDLVTCATDLRARDPLAFEKLEFHALDLDATGEVVPIARRRAATAGVAMHFYREDLFNSPGLNALFSSGTRFQVVNCIGLTAWLDLPDVERLARFFHDRLLASSGALIVDNWARHQHSALGKDLEINTRYHPAEAFVDTLEKAGFRVEEAKVTPNGICTVYVARLAGGAMT